MTTTDRAAEALLNHFTYDDFQPPVIKRTVAVGAAKVLQVAREDLARARQLGDVIDLDDVDEWLASRIAHLTGASEAGPEPTVPTMAWVAVDEQGRLTPDSTVTVGEWTWPVPERTEEAGVAAPVRIGVALRERGWRMVPRAEHDHSRPGEVGIPVERIEG